MLGPSDVRHSFAASRLEAGPVPRRASRSRSPRPRSCSRPPRPVTQFERPRVTIATTRNWKTRRSNPIAPARDRRRSRGAYRDDRDQPPVQKRGRSNPIPAGADALAEGAGRTGRIAAYLVFQTIYESAPAGVRSRRGILGRDRTRKRGRANPIGWIGAGKPIAAAEGRRGGGKPCGRPPKTARSNPNSRTRGSVANATAGEFDPTNRKMEGSGRPQGRRRLRGSVVSASVARSLPSYRIR